VLRSPRTWRGSSHGGLLNAGVQPQQSPTKVSTTDATGEFELDI
jgi:hypothetical protein